MDILDYEELFPYPKRCLTVMVSSSAQVQMELSLLTKPLQYEALRLYPQVLSIPKRTWDTPETLDLDGRSITIPPQTYVLPNVVALQSHPDYWGSDSLTWRPSRWMDSPVPSANMPRM